MLDMNWIVTPTGQLKFAMGVLWFQMAICLIIVIGSVVEGRTDENAFGFCFTFLLLGFSALMMLMQVLKFLKQSPESD
tara:strand:+ start:158 stop:391 length:234 start_codon:yes stop_codon:yes gene_type:complete